MFNHNNKTAANNSSLLFLCNYKYKETTRACCGVYVGKRDDNHRHEFSNIAQLTALFDKYKDIYLYDSKRKSIKQYLMTMRIYGTIDGHEIQPFELNERSDCQKFFDQFLKLNYDESATRFVSK
jgi:hypothetical protein